VEQHALLQTKLSTPLTQPELGSYPRLINHLSTGLLGQSARLLKDRSARKLTVISASAGFGKITLAESLRRARTETGSNPRPYRGMNAA
jgi:ATP/maltotriose-dependent transcriptional regulator MalT